METLLVPPFTKGKNKELLHFFLKCGVNRFSVNIRHEKLVQAALSNDKRPLALWQELQARLGANKKSFNVSVNGVKKTITRWIFRLDALTVILETFPQWPTDSFRQHFEWGFYKDTQLLVSTTSNQRLLLHNLIPLQLADLKSLGFPFADRPDPRETIVKRADTSLQDIHQSGGNLRPVEGGEVYHSDSNMGPDSSREVESSELMRSISIGKENRLKEAAANDLLASLRRNEDVLKWWTPAHDDVLAAQISKQQRRWWPDVKEIVSITPSEKIETFKKEKTDPHVWNNVIYSFARARAIQLGLYKDEYDKFPTGQSCAICGEDSREINFRFTDLCNPCVREHTWGGESNTLSRDEVLDYLRRLTETLQRVPATDFGSSADTLLELSTPKRVAILKLLKGRPSLTLIKYLFGSWLAALVEAKILTDGTQEGVFGTRCLAKDGHQCLSLAEKTIDDFLTMHNISHDKEVSYPGAGYRADFSVRGIFIEYFGLKGNQEYDLKTMAKIDFCKGHSIQLVELYAEDLTNDEKLKEKLRDVWKFRI